MSHEVETMAYVGEVPWHGLGSPQLPGISTEEMLKAAGLAWEVKLHPQYFEFNGKKKRGSSDVLLRMTDGRQLTEVGKDWKPVQNHEAFEFFNEFVKRGDMSMETAGSLHDGQIVWALAKVNESFELFGGDKVDAYLLFTNPHKYGQTTSVQFNPIRVVCANTLALAFEQKVQNMVRISHRRQFDAENVKTMLGITHNKLNKYKETAEFLGSRKAEKNLVVEYMKEVFPLTSSKKESKKDFSRNAQKALDAIATQPGANFAEGSWWSVFNSVTFTTDHLVGRSQDTRLASAWYGVNRQRKVDALKKAVNFADKSPLLLAA